MGDLTHGGRGWTPGSLWGGLRTVSWAASQGEVLHPRRQVSTASGPKRLELRIPLLEVPDLVVGALSHEHHFALDLREVAHLRRDEEASRAVELHLLGEADEQPLP